MTVLLSFTCSSIYLIIVEKGNLNIAYIELALVVTCFSIKKRLNIHQLRRILLQFVVHIRFLQ
jgi:hypothetical protein